MKHLSVLLSALLFCTCSKSPKKETPEIAQPVPDTARGIIARSVPAPEEEEKFASDFSGFLKVKWSTARREKNYSHKLCIINNLVLPDNLADGWDLVDLDSARIIYLNNPNHLAQVRSRLADSVYWLKYKWAGSMVDIFNQRSLQAGKNPEAVTPQPMTHVIEVIEYNRNTLAALQTDDPAKVRWTYVFDTDAVWEIFNMNTLALVETKNGIHLFDKQSGDKKWSMSRPENVFIREKFITESAIGIVSGNTLVKLEPASGDTLLIETFKGKIKDGEIVRQGDDVFFAVENEGVFRYNFENGEKKWRYSEGDLDFLHGVAMHGEHLYVFQGGKIVKLRADNGDKIWETRKADYGSPYVITDLYILTSAGGYQEGGIPALIDGKTGKLLAVHFNNMFYKSESDHTFISDINVGMSRLHYAGNHRILDVWQSGDSAIYQVLEEIH
ncbi:PQQ-binding-like beta-propeller repeat protein [Fulvivirgaceae bacterium PWU4]|uniref:PQQ-binding-like beta-propeller repeat protein n=1 Tax=Chryseosolibacter histidini TaxID=2782349 RepID=A0AAP2DJA7_9BACT|nr:PQQ-binding-like beta-propeller repeat protein [Chryseosolibacter histidini]MBT1696027.1 PQQ-binding-like beta-propeller repeat protein [Chryseosolibacter histidini]